MNTENHPEHTPLVSIIVPVFNRAHLISRTVGCLINQSYQKLEIILVDDCSDDDIESAAEALNDSRVKLIRHTENGGASAARNTGIKHATGELIAFHDSDDVCVFDKIERQVHLLSQLSDEYIGIYTAVLFYTGVPVEEYGHMAAQIGPAPSTPVLHGNMYESTLRGNVMNLPTMLLKRNAVEKAGGFDERLRNNNDWDFTLRVTRLGLFSFLPEPLYLVSNPFSFQDKRAHISTSLNASSRSFAIITGKLRRAGEKSPKLARSYYTLASILMRRGKAKSARRYLCMALSLNRFHYRSIILYPISFFPNVYMSLRRLRRRGKPEVKV